MQIVDNLIIVLLIISSFIAGLKLSGYYRDRADLRVKEALEKQYLRLRARMDADDPCKPYGTPKPVLYTGDTDGDYVIGKSFMDQLKSTGRAKTTFRKSDIAK